MVQVASNQGLHVDDQAQGAGHGASHETLFPMTAPALQISRMMVSQDGQSRYVCHAREQRF